MKKKVSNSQLVGIDLGTTNSVMSIYDDTGKAKVTPNKDGETKTPSVVYIGPGCKEVLVGTAAWNMQMLEPERTLKEFKRDVGTDKVYFKEGDQEITPEWCQTQVLRYLRESAIEYFGDDRAASQAVITVPAYFTEKERQSVKKSANAAGIEVLRLINEPTAGGLAFGLNEKQGDRKVLILDLGGGTFDASSMAYSGQDSEVLGSHGDKHLGGKDIDDLLIGIVCEEFRTQHGLEISQKKHPAELFSILEEVRRQKHSLSNRKEVQIACRVDGKQVVIPITRERLASAMGPLLDRIEKVILELLSNAKMDRSEIKEVLLIGGSSRVVPYRDRVKHLFGKDCLVGGQVSVDLAVAEGAVIHAARTVISGGDTLVNEKLESIPAPAITHTDVMPHSLGVSVQDRVSSAEYCSVILKRNTPIPHKETKRFASVTNDQTMFKVTVVQGEEGQPLGDCLVVGERELNLPPRKNSEPTLEAEMGYDESGLVTVRVHDLVTGKVEDITVDFYKNN